MHVAAKRRELHALPARNQREVDLSEIEYRLARDYFHKALDVYRTTLGDNCEKSEYVIETKGNITEMEALMDP